MTIQMVVLNRLVGTLNNVYKCTLLSVIGRLTHLPDQVHFDHKINTTGFSWWSESF